MRSVTCTVPVFGQTVPGYTTTHLLHYMTSFKFGVAVSCTKWITWRCCNKWTFVIPSPWERLLFQQYSKMVQLAPVHSCRFQVMLYPSSLIKQEAQQSIDTVFGLECLLQQVHFFKFVIPPRVCTENSLIEGLTSWIKPIFSDGVHRL